LQTIFGSLVVACGFISLIANLLSFRHCIKVHNQARVHIQQTRSLSEITARHCPENLGRQISHTPLLAMLQVKTGVGWQNICDLELNERKRTLRLSSHCPSLFSIKIVPLISEFNHQ